MTTGVAVLFDGPQPYASVDALQARLQEARARDEIPDTVLLLEHQPVVTLGRRGRDQHLKTTPALLAERGIELYRASRGGDVTFHGPGQLVVYPILKLGGRQASAHGYLDQLEELALRTAEDFGVVAFRRPGMSGAWTERGKLAAIGFRLKRWVSCHGLSFNVDLDLSGFATIVPCGLTGEPVTSLREILGRSCPPLSAVADRLHGHAEGLFARSLPRYPATGPLPAPLEPFFEEWRTSGDSGDREEVSPE